MVAINGNAAAAVNVKDRAIAAVRDRKDDDQSRKTDVHLGIDDRVRVTVNVPVRGTGVVPGKEGIGKSLNGQLF